MQLRQRIDKGMQKPIQHSPVYCTANQDTAELARRLLTGRNDQHRHPASPMPNEQVLLIMSIPPLHMLHYCVRSCDTFPIA